MSGPRRFDKAGKPIEGSERIPTPYLESLFGPSVHDALKTLHAELDRRKAGEHSELLDTLIAYKHSDMFRLDKPRPTGFKLPVLK